MQQQQRYIAGFDKSEFLRSRPYTVTDIQSRVTFAFCETIEQAEEIARKLNQRANEGVAP